MRFHRHPISRTERAASFAAAIGVTVDAVLLIFAGLAQRFLLPSQTESADTAQNEQITYLTPALPLPAPVAVPRTSMPATRSPRSSSTPAASTASVARPTPAVGDTSSRSSTAAVPSAISPVAKPVAPVPAGASIAGARVGFTRPTSDSLGPVAPVVFKPLPPTQAEVDAKARDEAFDAAAARGAGEPVRTTMVGGGIAVGLPGGGPSKKQRERDRAIFADIQKIRAQRQLRIDSVVAARKRADSLIRLADSSRKNAPARP
jgi:hypothetical protein